MWDLIFDKVVFPISGVETYWWLPGLVAMVISFFASMGGLSGAFLLLPFQVSILGFKTPAVTPTNLIFNMVAIPAGVLQYVKEKRMVWPLAITTIIGTLPGLILGAYMRVYWFADPATFQVFVGLVLLYILLRLIFDIIKPDETSGKKAGKGTFEVEILRFDISSIKYMFEENLYSISTPAIFLLALLVGIVGGAYGIGGGAIIAPFVVTIFGLPVHTVAGAALMGTFVTSVVGVLIYQFIMPILMPAPFLIQPDWPLGLSFGVGGLVGVYLGARMQRHFPARIIKALMAIAIGVVVINYLGGFVVDNS
jgi:uncharacterized membrane protein YfcA